MFTSLEEDIDKTEGKAPTASARIARAVVVLVLSVFAFGGLYAAIRLLE